MKIIAIAFLMLLTPIFASEDDLAEQYRSRVQAAEKEIEELHQNIYSFLKARDDLLASALEQIRAKRSRLDAPESFSEELDSLLSGLKHPENLLSDRQRHNLIGFPNLEDFQPINELIDKLDLFIKIYQATAASAEGLQVAANQILWYQQEWSSFSFEISRHLTNNTLTNGHYLEIYRRLSYFHSTSQHVQTACNRTSLGTLSSSQAENYKWLNSIASEITKFFQKRGTVLWELIKKTINMADLPESYQDIKANYFLDTANPLKRFLEAQPTDQSVELLVPKTSSPPKKSSSAPGSPISHKKNRLTSIGGSQTPPLKRVATQDPHFERRLLAEKLRQAFEQSRLWEDQMKDFKEKALLLINAKFIVSPLSELLDYYNNFKPLYLNHLNEAYDILTPKAHLVIPGLPIARIPQSLARRVCSLESNGPLCVNLPKNDEETVLGFSSFIENLAFKKRRESYPSRVGMQFTQYWFEALFGIPSDPTVFLACDDVSLYVPNSPNQNPDKNRYTKDIVTAPNGWRLKQDVNFITVHKRHTGDVLSDLLNKVATGEGTFEQLLDPESVGLHILFSFLTQACLTPRNLGLVKRENKFALKRIGLDSFLQPLFKLRDNQNHQFIGHNICYFLPFVAGEIPNGVKNNFLSNDIYLILSNALTQLTKLQEYYDELIQKYALTQPDMLEDELKIKISKAHAFGLNLAARAKTIQELIQNFNIISTQLGDKEVTYEQIWEKLRPRELQCYKKILENTQRETQTIPIFFEKVVPSILVRLRKAYDEAKYFGDYPSYSSEELDLFDQDLTVYRTKIQEYLTEMEKLYTKRIKKSIKIENAEFNTNKLEKAIEKKNAEILQLLEELEQLEDAVEKDIPQITIKTEEHAKLRVEVKENAGQIDKNNQTISTYREKIEHINKSLKNLSKKLSQKNLFEELKNSVSSKAQDFFQKRYTWAKKSDIFHASIILKAWESMFDTEKPIICEDLIKTLSPDSWIDVPVLSPDLSTMYAQLIESNHPIEAMVQDLISHADLSKKSLETQMEIMDSLLGVVPLPTKYHKSWADLLPLARKQFLALPPNVRTFFASLGLLANEEKIVLQKAQIRSFEHYEKRIATITKQIFVTSPSPEQAASHLLRHLWMGSLEMDQKNGAFLFDAILDLLLLPSHSSLKLSAEATADPGSIGFASHPLSRGGIFDLRYRAGDHYLLSHSEKWVELYRSSQTLSAKMRTTLLSHALPLLHIQWLQALQQLKLDVQFHPWFMKTLIEKSTILQQFLSTRLSFTFAEIMSTLWPEIDYEYQKKFKTHNNKPEEVLKDLSRRIDKMTPIESGADLDWTKNGKNLLSILYEWDIIHPQSIASPPLTLDDAATEWLGCFNPIPEIDSLPQEVQTVGLVGRAERHEYKGKEKESSLPFQNYGGEILAHILYLASQFNIDISKINSANWCNSQILKILARIDAPLECIQLATALRTGSPYGNMTLKRSGSSYTISGNTKILDELISLFPETDKLSLYSNQVRSLTPLMPSLLSLRRLTSLNLSENPIHNPSPLARLTQLNTLILRNTCIPEVHLPDLRSLISPNKKGTPLSLVTSYVNDHKEVCRHRETKLLAGGPDILLNRLATLMMMAAKGQPSHDPDFPLDPDVRICILEKLAETWWNETLDYGDINIQKIPDYFDKLFGMLQFPYDPRVSAFRLVFALKYGLPRGTIPGSLVENGFTNQASDLTHLGISGFPISSMKLKSLNHFSNLTHLSLSGIELVNLDFLPQMTTLQALKLTNNHITSLAGLHTSEKHRKFPGLQILILKNNQLTSNKKAELKLLAELPLLQLDLSDNWLDEVPKLGNICSLKYLDLRGNIITKGLKENTEHFLYTPQRDQK